MKVAILYRTELAKIAEYSDLTETGDCRQSRSRLARAAKQEQHSNPRLEARLGHVGYYLVGDGAAALQERVGFQPPMGRRIASFLRRHPSEFYLPGTEILTLAIMSAIVLLLTNTYTSPVLIFFSMVMLLLPCFAGRDPVGELPDHLAAGTADSSQARFLGREFPTTAPRWWPFPACCSTRNRCAAWWTIWKSDFWAITIPIFISRCSPILPDSREPSNEEDPLIDYCAQLIRELNEKYAGAGGRIVPALPSPPGLQPARTSVDGLGAKTRQADGLEQAAAQRARQLPGEGRGSFHSAANPLRDHAGLRTRNCRADRPIA